MAAYEDVLVMRIPEENFDPFLDPSLNPGKGILDYLILAILIEDLMEQVPVNLHLLILGGCLAEEFIRILHAYQAVLLPVEHQHRISKFRFLFLKPI